MGTKNNPGQFDCYENADPDEPMFVLLARDPIAPMLVDAWAAQRFGSIDPSDQDQLRKVQEARECAASMREWLNAQDPVAVSEAVPDEDMIPPPDEESEASSKPDVPPSASDALNKAAEAEAGE